MIMTSVYILIILIFIFRDMFVEEYMKPPNKVITESNLDFIFNLDDESMIVSKNFIDKKKMKL